MRGWSRTGAWVLAGVVVAALVNGPASVVGASLGSVRIGTPPRLDAGAVAVSALDPSAMLRVDIALRPRDPAGLARDARAVSDPGSRLYRHDLARGQFAAVFGPTARAIDTVESALRAVGLQPGAISSDHLVIPVRASARQLSAAFATGFRRYRVRSGRMAYANTSAPRVAAPAAPYVQSVIGLDDLHVATPAARGPVHPLIGSGPQPCPAAVSSRGSQAFTADQLASAYGFEGMYAGGNFGAGQTVAVVEFQSNLTTDVAAYQSCYGTNTSVTYVPVDGGAGKPQPGFEASSDIEIVSGLAPEASILVYQAPNTDPAVLDTYDAIVSQDVAKVISTSWGLCEQEGSGSLAAESTIYEQAAVQGQSIFSASGDSGVEDCSGSNHSLSVDDPSSQPFVTGVGATRITGLGPPPSETVWNGVWGASGGGISNEWTMPGYQTTAGIGVGTIDAYSSGAPCGAPAGSYCREVPDVSAVGGVFPYVLYYHGAWTTGGGTSLSTPLWAALIALTNASSACADATIGFANPALYDVAASDPSAFHDVTTGNNDFTGRDGGRYPASTGYDMASGIGTPNGNVLPSDLCAEGGANAVSVTNPGAQHSSVGDSINLPIVATDSSALTLGYSAFGLPTGLSINSSSGLISGTTTTPGGSTVVVSAKDSAGASDGVTFNWFVAPKITALKPAFGPAAGGTKVTISGVGFAGTTAVTFGATPAASFTVNGAGTKITAFSPAGSGAVFVHVTDSSGTSPSSAAAQYSYLPSITRIKPATGPTSGGTKVTIAGTNFTGATAVHFGANPATSFTVTSSKKIVAFAPAGSAGTVDITVTTAGGTGATGAVDRFTYQ